MFGNATQRKISELERADTLSQIRFWVSVYEQLSFEPHVRRFSVDEFYESEMPKFTSWLRNQMIWATVLILVLVAVVFSFKVARDHVKYQDEIIQHEISLIENELGNSTLANWFVSQRIQVLDDALNISGCGTCTEYRDGFTEYSYERLEVIDDAIRGKVRFTNGAYFQTFMALVGARLGYLLLRKLLMMREAIRATRRLNDALLATDPSFQAFTRN